MPLRAAVSSACLTRALSAASWALPPAGFAVALALIPPLDEVAAFGVVFVLAVDADVIAANSALAVEQGRRACRHLSSILTCLRRVTRGSLGIWRFLENRQ